jgi:hypothetical protein
MTVVSLVACAGRQVCGTTGGAADGVSVTLDSELIHAAVATPAGAAATITLKACVDDVCESSSYVTFDSSLFIAVSPVKKGAVSVSLKITTSAATLFTAQTQARTIKSQPNGPGCPPAGWYVNVAAHADGRLTS